MDMKQHFFIADGYYVACLVMPYGLVGSSQPLDIEGSFAKQVFILLNSWWRGQQMHYLWSMWSRGTILSHDRELLDILVIANFPLWSSKKLCFHAADHDKHKILWTGKKTIPCNTMYTETYYQNEFPATLSNHNTQISWIVVNCENRWNPVISWGCVNISIKWMKQIKQQSAFS